MGVKEYVLEIYGFNGKLISKYRKNSLTNILWSLCNILKEKDILDVEGFFKTTVNPFTNNVVIKRYCINIIVPPTTFVVRKVSTGSIPINEFKSMLNYIKEMVNERV